MAGREVDAPHGKLMGLDPDSNHAMGDDPVLAVEEKYTRFRKDVTGSCILEKNMTWFLAGEWRGWDVLLFSHPIFILLRAHLFVMARHKKTN